LQPNSKQHSKPTGKEDEMAESIAERVAREIAEEFDLPLYDNNQDPAAEWMTERIQAAIDEAVLAERQACEGIAAEYHDHSTDCGGCVGEIISQLIRARNVGAPTSTK
jgi:hypothetical protein